MSRRVVPVSRLVRYIKESMESDPVLRGVMIEGEISNLRIPNSQHWYFSLKDENAGLRLLHFVDLLCKSIGNPLIGFSTSRQSTEPSALLS